MKTALLTNGIKLEYDRVDEVEERIAGKVRKLYHFYRGRIGLVAIIPQKRLEKLEV
jgi:hypothetical protein